MESTVKIAVIGAIMAVLLLVGLLVQPVEEPAKLVTVTPVAVAPASVTTVTEVTVVHTRSLELLDPVYSEKAVFQDSTIRVSFNASFVENGFESRIPLWIHNVSRDVITILWDRCSIQLPGGNTVGLLTEEGLKYGTGPALSIASTGDLFDALIPVSEIVWSDAGYAVTTGVLDQGAFTVVLAVERATVCLHSPAVCVEMPAVPDECGEPVPSMPVPSKDCGCPAREIVYYMFRFIVR
ncbi:MAG: hypothetical protein PHV11_01830 [Candidatus Bipolaricaulis sp.]|nr:hypothetical protein [Candidatus Bipolaricaulis sp.]